MQATQQQTAQAQQQIQQLHPVQQTIVSQSPVSVVLTAPVSSIQNMQSQIVSIQQAVIPSTSIVTQANTGQIVQTIPAQAATSQVVSVSQLTGVGTVFTTSGLQSNATTSSLRTQRIVTAPLQEMVFSPRSGTQSSAVVSVSGLTAQGVNQTQLQPNQLRLSMAGSQQVVTKGGIPMIGAITAAGKPIGQQAQFQILRQTANSARQQFKVLNTGQGNTVLQTVGGQVSVVNQSGAIIQGGIVATGTNVGQTLQLQPTSGQKVSLATVTGVTGSPNVASVASIQMNSGNTTTQQRAHFMKQVGTKQQMARSVAMPVSETEMLLVKRQMVNQSQANQASGQVQHQQSPQQSQSPQQQVKTQILQQFTPSIQLQSSGSGQQHIALVKTSTGTMATTGGTVGMTLAQIKPSQLKATLPGVRQMQLQQIPIGQQSQRKNATVTAGKMTQITQVSGNLTGASGTSGGNNAGGGAKTTTVGKFYHFFGFESEIV